MTNQKMVISDAESAIPLAFAVLFPPNGHFPWKKLLKKPGANNLPRHGSMPPCSTRCEPRRPSDADDHASWTLHHSSALNAFGEIASASRGKRIVIFLDYDRTLLPIVADPDHAYMTNEMREAVRDAATLFPTAIVSGRSRAKVHGMDIKGPSRQGKTNQTVLCQPAREFLPVIEEVMHLLRRLVEWKKLSLPRH